MACERSWSRVEELAWVSRGPPGVGAQASRGPPGVARRQEVLENQCIGRPHRVWMLETEYVGSIRCEFDELAQMICSMVSIDDWDGGNLWVFVLRSLWFPGVRGGGGLR